MVRVAPATAEMQKVGGSGETNVSIQDDSIDDQCMKHSPPDPGFFEKGNISNIITFLIMVAGLAMRFGMDTKWDDNVAGRYILAFGLFGFAGGITNWLAVKMLFDEIPGVYGSGIIPKQFKQIRNTIKEMIMDTFFEPAFLQKQLSQKLGSLISAEQIEKALLGMLEAPEFDAAINQKLQEISSTPMGTMIKMAGITAASIKPMLKPFISGISGRVAPMVSDIVNGGADAGSPIMRLRDEVNRLMEERLQELTAQRVKGLIEAVMRAHLGWLVVWGNIFGGFLCVISEGAGY